MHVEAILSEDGADVGEADRGDGRVEVLERAELFVEVDGGIEEQDLHAVPRSSLIRGTVTATAILEFEPEEV